MAEENMAEREEQIVVVQPVAVAGLYELEIIRKLGLCNMIDIGCVFRALKDLGFEDAIHLIINLGIDEIKKGNREEEEVTPDYIFSKGYLCLLKKNKLPLLKKLRKLPLKDLLRKLAEFKKVSYEELKETFLEKLESLVNEDVITEIEGELQDE